MNLNGVVMADVSYDDKRADVRYVADLVDPAAMVQAIDAVGFSAMLMESE